MKRSQINMLLADAEDFFQDKNIHLPPFAYWSPKEFAENVKKNGYQSIVTSGAGWILTDFGTGDFTTKGIVVFTTRMGDYRKLSSGRGRLYAEKFIIQREDQVTPLHRHLVKTEDIINRGDGLFCLRLYHSTPTGDLDVTTNVKFDQDGLRRSVAPGDVIKLKPGEGITIDEDIFHEFWAEKEDALATEISLVNDDATDNYFLPEVTPLTVDEDEPPRRWLIRDYLLQFPELFA